MKRRNIIRLVKGLLVFLLLTLAAGLISYPYIANYVFEHRVDSVINAAQEAVDSIDDSEQQQAIQAARDYNYEMASGRVQLTDPFIEDELEADSDDYESLLCVTEEGVMGFVEIPSIDVLLPIYHGTSEAVLEKGAGHLQGSSLPVGGESTHTVLTGHTGLSNAKLFTDLTELENGDIFFLKVMGEKLAYKVDQIKVVLPSEMKDIQIVSGEDYCTLLTCTPYGINSHRLMVRGVRTDYEEAVADPETYKVKPMESKWASEYKHALYISVTCFAVSLVFLVIYRVIHNYRYGIRSGEITDDFL